MTETLRQLINRGPVDPSTALNLLGQLLNALEFAHWRGVIHGNITPENIVLTSSRQTTLAHFGIAPGDGDAAPAQTDGAGRASGYLAPELINGGPANERTDIFALGVVAYEMLTGRHPFGASDDLAAGSVVDHILRDAPLEIPQAILAGLPRHIPSVLDVALAKRPRDRFPDAMSFLEALNGPVASADALVPSEPSLPGDVIPPVSRSRRKWLAAAVLGGLVIAALVVIWAVTQCGDPGLDSSTTVTSGDTTSTGQSVSATAATTITTTTTAAPTTTIATTTTTAIITTTTVTILTRSEQTDPLLVYAGDWSTTTDVSASERSLAFANSNGASVTVAFEGTYLAWIAKKSPVYGKAKVTLDGKSLGTIDLYSPTTGWQQKVWGSGTLKPGLHTVTITWTGTKNSAATDTNICVDAFDVVGSLTQIP